MPGFIGIPELMLLGLVVLLVFGPKRLPEMGRSMGRGFREFKNSVTGDKNDADAFAIPLEDDDHIDAPVLATVPSEQRKAS